MKEKTGETDNGNNVEQVVVDVKDVVSNLMSYNDVVGYLLGYCCAAVRKQDTQLVGLVGFLACE